VVEREGKIVLVNRAALDLFGFNGVPESEPRSLLEFVAPERSADAEGVIQALYARDCQVPLRETRLLRRDGSVMDSEIAASSYLHEGSRSVQVLVRDISQRKHDEAEKARMFRAIEQAAESIVITDKNAKIVFVNPAFERVSGYTREEAIGLNPRVLKSGHQPPEFYTSMWQKLAAGESWTGRFINRAKDGRLYTEEATISPVVNREGELINYVAVKRDVTAENALQEQLHQSQKMDAVGRLAGGVAHDFNNMLMVINSYAELLAADLGEQDPRYVYTTKILRAAERSAALTRQLLTFSRKQVFSPVVLDCNAILAETCSMVRRLIAENIELKYDLSPDLWSTKADPDQLVQVILNLCLNARDAMPHGGTLTLSTRNYLAGDGYVEIAIADTGIGIPLDLQEKLFEPFFTTKGVEKGTGLGLSIVYGSVQQSGGYITVESLPGFGATFHVYLPRSTEQLIAERKKVLKTVPSEPALVLLVEDEEALRVAIAEHLRSNGCRVIGASDGVEALKLLSENPGVAILITDLIMPRMGGRELVRLATKNRPELRVMVLSGYANESFSSADCNGCPSAFLMKPFSLGAMMARLSELRNSQRSTIAPPAHEN
jgi:PAS domain S-box-containing protein